MVHAGGRPLKFQSVKELEEKIQAYFDSCFREEWRQEQACNPETGEPLFEDVGPNASKPIYKRWKEKVQIESVTITGLAYHLDTSRKVLLEYQSDEEFSNTITRAKQFIEHLTEKRALDNKINANFAVFNMKNNWGWKDEMHTKITDGRLTEEQQKKMDDILENKTPNESDKPSSANPGENGDKGAA